MQCAVIQGFDHSFLLPCPGDLRISISVFEHCGEGNVSDLDKSLRQNHQGPVRGTAPCGPEFVNCVEEAVLPAETRHIS